jgi:hypothetical protein
MDATSTIDWEEREPGSVSAASRGPARLDGLTSTPARAAACLLGLAAVTLLARISLVSGYVGPWIFDDELGYRKLAQSLGTTGHLALFGKQGLTYSPLYPLIISPLFRLGLSGVDVYHWTKVVNCLLMTVALLPIYKIARFVLPRGRAVLATALSALAPLVLYSTLEMSENAAFPVCLFALWAMLVAIRSPSARHDAILLLCCAVATAARVQFVVLVPAAFGAVVIDAFVQSGGIRSAARRVLKEHRLLTLTTTGALVLGVAALAGTKVLAVTGQYSQQLSFPTPSPWELAKLSIQHLAGLDLAVAVIPFAGTLVAAWLWARGPSRRETTAFAAMALSVTTLLVLLVAFTAYGQEHSGGSDLPRIHERYLIYVLPLFTVAMLATTAIPRSGRMLRLGLVAAAIAGLLPATIPYGTVVNNTVAADTFGLSPFVALARGGGVQALRHATVALCAYALCLALLYALARPNAAIVVSAVAALFIYISTTEQALLDVASRSAMHWTPSAPNWVDVAGPQKGVAFLEAPRRTQRSEITMEETAFFNLSVSRLYSPCGGVLQGGFGEVPVKLDSRGRWEGPNGPIRAGWVIAPVANGIAGRVVAVDRPGRLALIRPSGGVLRVVPSQRRAWVCPPR